MLAGTFTMALPEIIPTRYTEQDAGYMSVRPVIKQTFQLRELIDLIVSVAGKDAARVQQILGRGSAVYHGFRYCWDALAAELPELEALLAAFPDDDPSRPFVPEAASAVLFEMGGGTQRTVTEILQQAALHKRLFAKQSPWDVLTGFAKSHTARYEKYDHARKADLFRLTIPFEPAQQLLAAMLSAAPRKLRYRWSILRPPAAITFIAPRN
jgi:hypothetical protein